MSTTGLHDHDEANKDQAHQHGKFALGERTELCFAVASGILLALGYVSAEWLKAEPSVPLALYIGAFLAGGFFTSWEAIENLRKGNFAIDSLMIVAAVGAALLNKWAEGALLLSLFSIGHALEGYALGRAKRAVEALATLAPKTARVFRGAEVNEIAVSDIRLGDRVLIRSNERIPVDGYVIKGSSAVDQAPVTGESIPVEKIAIASPPDATNLDKLPRENFVFTGTINGSGALEVIATKLSSESTLARIVKLVSEAQAEASPTEQFTKKIERYFVPIVLLGCLALLFAFLIVDEPFSASFYRAMAVLVAASPCALAISTPSAVLSGIARAGRSGVLIKSGAALENLGRVNVIAFDKTGTLTQGNPAVTDVVGLNAVSEEYLIQTAAALERSSDHPLASAIVRYAEKQSAAPPLEATQVTSLTGKGIQGNVGGEDILVGKPGIFTDKVFWNEIDDPVKKMQALGRTVVVVASEQKALGILGIMDPPRANAKQALETLLESGLKKLIMLSGDHQKVAEAIANQTGITDAIGDLMPDDKVDAVKRLRREFGLVAMVGDGVNDAPAMASSTVGIAMGAAGSDVALETADIALMTSDLEQLAFSVRLSRQASRIIKQNLFVSLGVVVVLIPATIFGLGIGPAVVAHEGSTLVVVFNALRLLIFRDRRANGDRKRNG